MVEHLITESYDTCLNQCKGHDDLCKWVTYSDKTHLCQLFEECDPPDIKRTLIQQNLYLKASQRECPASPDCNFQGKCQVCT